MTNSATNSAEFMKDVALCGICRHCYPVEQLSTVVVIKSYSYWQVRMYAAICDTCREQDNFVEFLTPTDE